MKKALELNIHYEVGLTNVDEYYETNPQLYAATLFFLNNGRVCCLDSPQPLVLLLTIQYTLWSIVRR